MQEAMLVECPYCHGRGQMEGVMFICARPSSASRVERNDRVCEICAGSGTVRPERAEAYRSGRADREERVHVRYQTQGQRAAELGITVLQLSRWENYGEHW